MPGITTKKTIFTRPIFDSLSQFQTNPEIAEKTTKNPIKSELPNYTRSDETIEDQMVKRKRVVNHHYWARYKKPPQNRT